MDSSDRENPYAPPPVPPCHCKEIGVFEICPLCTGGLMPLVYALVMYAIYDEIGYGKTVHFSRMVVQVTWDIFSFCLAVFGGAAFLSCAAVLVWCVCCAIVEVVKYGWQLISRRYF